MNTLYEFGFEVGRLELAGAIDKTAEQQYSPQPFDPAFGYKHPNAQASPTAIYKNQMYRSGLEVAEKAKNPKYRFSHDYNTAMQHYGGLPPKPPAPPALQTPLPQPALLAKHK